MYIVYMYIIYIYNMYTCYTHIYTYIFLDLPGVLSLFLLRFFILMWTFLVFFKFLLYLLNIVSVLSFVFLAERHVES